MDRFDTIWENGLVKDLLHTIFMADGIPFKAFLFTESTKPEIRRFNMDRQLIGKLRPLKTKLREVYPTLKMKSFTVAWKDEEDDEILVSTDIEVITMCRQAREAVIKLVLRNIGMKHNAAGDIADPKETKPFKLSYGLASCFHRGIICDICGCPFAGFRYKCITCDDFDLCVRCEKNGQHPEHCVVRVPVPDMPLPIIKASMKKSRRILKSIAHEENKKLRLERKTAADANTNFQGKKDMQNLTNRNWIQVCTHYLDEFTKLAGNLAFHRFADNKPEPKSYAYETEEPIINEAEAGDDCPWKLPEGDLNKLEHACKFLSQYTSVAPLTEAGPSVEETNADSSARVVSPKKDGSPPTEDSKCRQDVLEAIKRTIKVLKASPGSAYHVRSNGGSQSKKVDSTESAAMPTSGKGSPDTTVPEKSCDTELSTSEIVEAARKLENSSNASSCSCLSNHSDKAEGWTVIDDPRGEFLKDTLIDTENSAIKNDELTKKLTAVRTSLYPQLNAATAVLDPKEAVDAPAAANASANSTANATANATTSAPPMDEAKAAPKPAQAKAKPAQAKAKPKGQTDTAAIDQLDPHVEAAVRQMEAMGFCNESGWLSQLLAHNDGNIEKVLDLITPVVPQLK